MDKLRELEAFAKILDECEKRGLRLICCLGVEAEKEQVDGKTFVAVKGNAGIFLSQNVRDFFPGDSQIGFILARDLCAAIVDGQGQGPMHLEYKPPFDPSNN